VVFCISCSPYLSLMRHLAVFVLLLCTSQAPSERGMGELHQGQVWRLVHNA
jgi:hypothetical protein